MEKQQYVIRTEEFPALVPPQNLIAGSISAIIAEGKKARAVIAERQPGYHSKPHRHSAEQLNYVMEGEMLLFIEDDGFVVRTGDFVQVPAGAVRWSWVRGDKRCVLLEIQMDPTNEPRATGSERFLVAPAESPDPRRRGEIEDAFIKSLDL